MIGRSVSHYEILDEIGRGGMGIVYRARDTKLNREVALKVLPAELVADEERRGRFFQEAQAAAALKHPHVAVIHEIDEADGVTFMALELIEGDKLAGVLERERLSIRRALELAVEVAEGLASAHAKGIVHRDLKPANVMLTDEGHSKVIDFGLAKLFEPRDGDGDTEGETVERRETDPGVVMGTVAYMSPEQACGKRVDHRSDVFSFGIMLHEMLSGQLPFVGKSSVETLNAILNAPPEPLTLHDTTLGELQRAEIERIVRKCLAKDVNDRYQTMKDLAVDLKNVHRATDTDVSIRVAPARSRFPVWAFAAAAAAMAAAIGFVAFERERSPESAATADVRDKPSVAVMFFQNQSGDPELDWLRTALTDMLVTDMSQSPNVEVLGTDRLYQIMEELNRLDERVTSFTVVQEVAERADVDRVILGSFVKAGDTIRISVRVQDAASGEILSSEQVEGVGEASLFPMVDDLTRRIKGNFELPESAELAHDRGLSDVTTPSPEAYRYYAEGSSFHSRGRHREAIPLFEKAVEADPEFALAMARLGIAHWNLGHTEEFERYSRRAVELADRLPGNQRHYIEGTYYGGSLETAPRGLAAYHRALELYPDATAARNNLAFMMLELYQLDESIEHYERLLAAGYVFPPAYSNLSRGYSMQNEPEKSLRVVEGYRRDNPNVPRGLEALAEHMIVWGRLDEAETTLAALEASGGPPPRLWRQRWALNVLRERWEAAADDVSRFVESEDAVVAVEGLHRRAVLALYRGKPSEAQVSLEQAIRMDAAPDPEIARSRNYRAHVLLETGEPSRALTDAELAARTDRRLVGYRGLLFAGMARAALGQTADAEATAERMHEIAAPLDSPRLTSWYHLLLGEIAAATGDQERAIAELTTADSLSPARGLSPDTAHVAIWFSLASVHAKAGNDAEAATWFGRIAEVGIEHVWQPIPYIRSFYFLGRIHEERGDAERARAYYQRFVDFWGEGEIDRERVSEARSKL